MKRQASPCWACNNMDEYWKNKLASTAGGEPAASEEEPSDAPSDDEPSDADTEADSGTTPAPERQ